MSKYFKPFLNSVRFRLRYWGGGGGVIKILEMGEFGLQCIFNKYQLIVFFETDVTVNACWVFVVFV